MSLEGWLFPAQGERRATIVYLHGVADNRAGGQSLAERFNPLGFDVLAYDSRAHGSSGGEACTFGFYEKRDLARVVERHVEDEVILLGSSLGGSVALQATPLIPRVIGVVAIAPFADLRSIIAERTPTSLTRGDVRRGLAWAEDVGRFEIDEVSALRAASSIDVPVLLIHGSEDDDTVPAHSERLHRALASSELVLVPGAGHDDAWTPATWDRIEAWVLDRVPR